MASTQLTLHGYYRSSCSGRLRIALLVKKIPFSYVIVNIDAGEQSRNNYPALNPSQTVPTLITSGRDGSSAITQSLAALEYLEEAFPDSAVPLLPPRDNLLARALVRSLSAIIAADTQPLGNSRVLERARELGESNSSWGGHWYERGLSAFEGVLRESGCQGKFCVGDSVTMADVCLVPALWNAEKWGVRLAQFPLVESVYANLSQMEAFIKGHWKNQPDCPGELRR